MILEHVFTSVPKGLSPGSRGFSTAAATQGLTPPLVQLCEALSGYTHLFPLQSPNYAKNPIAYSHYRATVGGRPYHVLSRVAALPADYSGRTNKIAHHLLVPPSDMTPAGPAAELAVAGRFFTAWEGEPRHLPENRLSLTNPAGPTGVAAAWKGATGDAGWAGVLARHWLSKTDATAYLIFTPETGVLPLIQEALRLIPPERRWDATFSTYVTTPPAGIACRWRCCLPDNPLPRAASKQAGTLVINLAQPGAVPATAESDPLVRAARTGEQPTWTAEERHPSALTRRAASDESLASGTATATQTQARHPHRITSVRASAEPLKKSFPLLWLPPLAACAILGVAAIYLKVADTNLRQQKTTSPDSNYICVTNFVTNCETKANELESYIRTLDDLCKRLNEITNSSDHVEWTKSYNHATNAHANLTSPNTNDLEYNQVTHALCSLTHRADTAMLSNMVETSWNKVEDLMKKRQTHVGNYECAKTNCLNHIEKTPRDGKETTSDPLPKQADAQSLPHAAGKTNKIIKITGDLLRQDVETNRVVKALVPREMLTNCEHIAEQYQIAIKEIGALENHFPSNEVALLKQNLEATKIIDPVKAILDMEAEPVNANTTNASILITHTFPTAEVPCEIFLWHSYMESRVTVSNAPAPFEFELGSDFPLASVLSITTVNNSRTNWHLFAPAAKDLTLTVSTNDWDFNQLDDGSYALTCKSGTPLYRLLSGVTNEVNKPGLKLGNYTGVVFTVRQKTPVQERLFEKIKPGKNPDISEFEKWTGEIADRKIRADFEEAYKHIKKDFKRTWREKEGALPEQEKMRVMLSIRKGNLPVTPGQDAHTTGSFERDSENLPKQLTESAWNPPPLSCKSFEDYCNSLPIQYRKGHETILAGIRCFDGKGMKPKEKKATWAKFQSDWNEADSKVREKHKNDLKESKLQGKNEASVKTFIDAFAIGFRFELKPALEALGWKFK